MQITLFLKDADKPADKVSVDVRPYLHDRITIDGATFTCTEVVVDYDAQEIRAMCLKFVPRAQSRQRGGR